MKILFYSPYLDILGGGEQYLLNFADCLRSEHEIYFVWKKPKILQSLTQRFGIDTSSFHLLPYLPARTTLRRFDIVFFVSDGSVPFLPLTKAILLFMSPFVKVGGQSLITQLKLRFIHHVLCFSQYTKSFIDSEFNVRSHLIYPAITIKPLNLPKQNYILSVGRFTTSLHHKRQDALIDAFIDIETKLPGWRLILAGGTEPGSHSFLKRLSQKARGHHISILTNVNNQKLQHLYAEAKLYWHAAGFGADLRTSPQKAEHFGISVVEAMAHGAVPLVYNAGGPVEVVTPQSGIVWTSLKELKQATVKLATHDLLRQQLMQKSTHRAQTFDKDSFCKQVHDLVEK